MTREEAIKTLKENICSICDFYAKDMESCNIAYCDNKEAIRTLEQETCEDAVSRAELKKWLDMNFSFGGALRKLELFERLDKELPSVIPKGVTVTDFADKCRECGKQKKGKWKRYIVDNGFNADWKCTECGYKVKTDFVHFNYCPNCGARMEE